MTTPESPTRSAWEPLTPKGVAAFAHASMGRLLCVQFVVAILVACAAVWFVHQAWFPVVRKAISQLPPQGEIRSGTLDWRGESPQRLAEGHFLSLAVDLEHSGAVRSPSHIYVEFGRRDVLVNSLFGYSRIGYPRGWIVDFNRTDLAPWWGAWEPPILGITALLVLLAMMVGWAALASVYYWPVWLAAFFANRKLDPRAGWKLAGAALMPGAVLMIAAIVLYGLHAIDLVRFAAVSGAHLVVGWVYLFLSLIWLPKLPQTTDPRKNPFAAPPVRPAEKKNDQTPPPAPGNP